jgi:hypothetical protein
MVVIGMLVEEVHVDPAGNMIVVEVEDEIGPLMLTVAKIVCGCLARLTRVALPTAV